MLPRILATNVIVLWALCCFTQQAQSDEAGRFRFPKRWQQIIKAQDSIPINSSEAVVRKTLGKPSSGSKTVWYYTDHRDDLGAVAGIEFKNGKVASIFVSWTKGRVGTATATNKSLAVIGASKEEVSDMLGPPTGAPAENVWTYDRPFQFAALYFADGRVEKVVSVCRGCK